MTVPSSASELDTCIFCPSFRENGRNCYPTAGRPYSRTLANEQSLTPSLGSQLDSYSTMASGSGTLLALHSCPIKVHLRSLVTALRMQSSEGRKAVARVEILGTSSRQLVGPQHRHTLTSTFSPHDNTSGWIVRSRVHHRIVILNGSEQVI